MEAYHQHPLPFLDLAGRYQAHTEGGVTLHSVVVKEVGEDMRIDGPTTTGDPVEAFQQASGGAAKHHQSESLATAEDEEVDQMVTGTAEEGEDGEPSRVECAGED